MELHMNDRQTKIFLASLGVAMVGQAMTAVAGQVIIKRHDKLVEQYNKLVAVTNEFARIAQYEQMLLDKHVDGRHLDEFDQVVLTDMSKSLTEKTAELKKLLNEDKK